MSERLATWFQCATTMNSTVWTLEQHRIEVVVDVRRAVRLPRMASLIIGLLRARTSE